MSAEADPKGKLMALLLTPGERRLRASVAAHTRWSRTVDRTEATRAAREAFLRRFEDHVDPNKELRPDVRRRNAESARRAYFQKLAYMSARARRARRAGEGV